MACPIGRGPGYGTTSKHGPQDLYARRIATAWTVTDTRQQHKGGQGREMTTSKPNKSYIGYQVYWCMRYLQQFLKIIAKL
jgi:hypothetical protein